MQMTSYKGHIYLMSPYWVKPGAPFTVVKEIDEDLVRIKLVESNRYYNTSPEAIQGCKKLTSIHDLVKYVLVGKNG